MDDPKTEREPGGDPSDAPSNPPPAPPQEADPGSGADDKSGK